MNSPAYRSEGDSPVAPQRSWTPSRKACPYASRQERKCTIRSKRTCAEASGSLRCARARSRSMARSSSGGANSSGRQVASGSAPTTSRTFGSATGFLSRSSDSSSFLSIYHPRVWPKFRQCKPGASDGFYRFAGKKTRRPAQPTVSKDSQCRHTSIGRSRPWLSLSTVEENNNLRKKSKIPANSAAFEDIAFQSPTSKDGWHFAGPLCFQSVPGPAGVLAIG